MSTKHLRVDKTLQLTDFHKKLQAKIGSFAGYQVPLEYRGAIREHLSVRLQCGVFDVSHMGLLEVFDTEAFLSICAGNIRKNRASYALILNLEGKILDDAMIFWSDRLLFCSNAINKFKILNYLLSLNIRALLTDSIILAVQGPNAESLLKTVLCKTIENLRHRDFFFNPFKDITLISRGGYTGEDGFELFIRDAILAERLFEKLLEKGAEPCGLVSRDTLRLEWALPLFGNELDETLYPNECGFPSAYQKEQISPRYFLKFFECASDYSCIPRKGWIAKDAAGNTVGVVTSGAKTPCLTAPVGFVRLHTDINEFTLEHGNRRVTAFSKSTTQIRDSIKTFKLQNLAKNIPGSQ